MDILIVLKNFCVEWKEFAGIMSVLAAVIRLIFTVKDLGTRLELQQGQCNGKFNLIDEKLKNIKEDAEKAVTLSEKAEERANKAAITASSVVRDIKAQGRKAFGII